MEMLVGQEHKNKYSCVMAEATRPKDLVLRYKNIWPGQGVCVGGGEAGGSSVEGHEDCMRWVISGFTGNNYPLWHAI